MTCNAGTVKTYPATAKFFVRAPWPVLKRRDSKGIYARTGQGQISNVVGIDIATEMPEAPDLILDNDATPEPEEAVRLILDCVSPTKGPGASLNDAASASDRLRGQICESGE